MDSLFRSLPLSNITQSTNEQFIGGLVDFRKKQLYLVRGDTQIVIIPLRAFQFGQDEPDPDFKQFKLENEGRTIRFGAYTTTSRFILKNPQSFITELFEIAENTGAVLEVISTTHDDGAILYGTFGGIAAILRYKLYDT